MLKEVISANVEVHTKMADSYNTSEPHYLPENREKVRKILEELQPVTGNKMLDVGCGTGFIIDLAKDLFDEIHGVDITQAMLDKVDTSSNNITLHNSVAEDLPFDDNYFDLVTSYAFIHHVFDYKTVLKELHRVVRPGGQVYIDLEPNKHFWSSLVELEKTPELDGLNLDEIVLRELDSVLHTGDQVEKDFGIDKEIFDNAEYTKTIMGGIDPDLFTKEMKDIGFSRCDVKYQWYLGQGSIMHGNSFKDAEVVERYLNRTLPLTKHLFKYVSFKLQK